MKKTTIAKRLTAGILALLYSFMFIGLAFGSVKSPSSSPSEAPESVSEPVDDMQEVVEEVPVVEPVEGQEEVVLEEAEEAKYEYFDVPLDQELQEYIFMVCDLYDNRVDPAIIIAMIEKESTYRADAIGDSGRSFGLMQIQQRWHTQRMLDLGVVDLLDPYQNVAVGIDYICELQMNGLGIEWSLMAYNGGVAYANRLRSEGRVSDYATYIVNRAEELGWRVW